MGPLGGGGGGGVLAEMFKVQEFPHFTIQHDFFDNSMEQNVSRSPFRCTPLKREYF